MRLILITAFLCLTAFSQSKYKGLVKMPIDQAKVALKNTECDDYLSALNSVLDSGIPEAEKHEVILPFLLDGVKLERLEKQKIKPRNIRADVTDVFFLSVRKLKDPNPLVLALFDHKLYDPKASERGRINHSAMLAGVSISPTPPSKAVLEKLYTSIGDVTRLGSLEMEIIACYADDKNLESFLDLSKTHPNKYLRRLHYQEAMRRAKHRPLVLKYIVDSYYEYNFPRDLLRLIMYNAPVPPSETEEISSFENVLPRNAKAIWEQLIRVQAVWKEVDKIPKRSDRPLPSEITRLGKICKMLDQKAKAFKQEHKEAP